MDKLTLPGDGPVLFLSCCAPCSGGIMESMIVSGIEFTVFFYNPNIHPRDEYEHRKREIVRFAEKKNVPFVEADYDSDNWFARVKGLENEPERGARCTQCFSMRLERSALYAHEHGFPILTSSLGFSRWKDMDQVNACGRLATQRYPGLVYWDINWRKGGGSQRGADVARAEDFYRQKYCGCVYSLRAAEMRQSGTGSGES